MLSITIISYTKMKMIYFRNLTRFHSMILVCSFLTFNFPKLTQARPTDGRHIHFPKPRDVTSPPMTTFTFHPSAIPSIDPSSPPSFPPSVMPSTAPSTPPTIFPSPSPSQNPSQQPSHSPFQYPSQYPSKQPSQYPSQYPSKQPSQYPSKQPSREPTQQPTHTPSHHPSQFSSQRLSERASTLPSQLPSHSLTIIPTDLPSINPSVTPSILSSYSPSTSPVEPRNEYNGCDISRDNLIGQQSRREMIVPYRYQMEYVNDFDLDEIIESLENDINTSLVKMSGFIRCSTKSSRNLVDSSVVGISSQPKDVVTEEICDPRSQVGGSECNIFDGGLTLYFYIEVKRQELEPIVEEDIAKDTKSMIQEMMTNGTLTDAHFAIVTLTFIEAKDGGDIIDNGIDDSGDNSDLDNDEGGPVPSYAWLILATGSILLTGFIGIFQYRGCKEEDVSSSDEDSDESSTDNSLVVEEHISDSTVDFSDEKQSSNDSRRSLDIFFSNSLVTDETPESKDAVEEDAETVVFSN